MANIQPRTHNTIKSRKSEFGNVSVGGSKDSSHVLPVPLLHRRPGYPKLITFIAWYAVMNVATTTPSLGAVMARQILNTYTCWIGIKANDMRHSACVLICSTVSVYRVGSEYAM